MYTVPKYKRVITLGLTDAIDTIQLEDSVYLRHGVWNNYTLADTEVAIKSIKGSHYGADVYFNDSNGKYYVSIPNDSDMW